MGVSRSLRCVRGFPAPLLALYFAACATGTEPAATDEDGGSAGTALAGALGSGAPGGGRGGSPSGGLSGSANGGAGSGGKAVFAGSGGAGAGSGGAQSGSGGNVSGSSGTGGASGGAGSSGKAGTSGMGGAGGVGGMNAGTGGMNAGTGGMNAGTGGMNGGAGGGCSNPVAKIEHSASAMVTAADCVELTHKASWTSVNVVITSQPGTMGYPITFRYGSCRTSGTGSFTRDYEAKALYKGENPNCSLFVQFEGAKSSALVFVHYD